MFHKSPGDHAAPALFSTTKNTADEDMLKAKVKADTAATAPDVGTVGGKPQQSRLYSGSYSLDERVATYGRPPSLAYSLPPAAGKQVEEIEAINSKFDGTTTNRIFYQDLPARAKFSPPKNGYYDTTLDDTKHRKTMALEREADFFASGGASTITGSSPKIGATAKSAGSGRGGALGEFTRNPKEAGSVYGVSVWSDEYAQWGTKLSGMSLSETRSKAMTKYF